MNFSEKMDGLLENSPLRVHEVLPFDHVSLLKVLWRTSIALSLSSGDSNHKPGFSGVVGSATEKYLFITEHLPWKKYAKKLEFLNSSNQPTSTPYSTRELRCGYSVRSLISYCKRMEAQNQLQVPMPVIRRGTKHGALTITCLFQKLYQESDSKNME